MKWRKILAAGMGLVMAAGLMSGCGGQTKEADNNKKDSQEKAMGRYVEEDLKPPIQDGETPVGAYEKDGTLWLYTSSGNAETGMKYYFYQYQDGKWSEAQEETGLTSAEMYVNHIEYGQDGNLYAMGTPTNTSEDVPYGWHVLKNNSDGDTWEDITPENLLKADESGYTAMLVDIDALADGSLCVGNGSSGQAEIYKDGEKVFSADMEPMMSNYQNTICASQNRLAVTAKDGKSVDFYDTEDYSAVGNVPLEEKGESYNIAAGSDGTWYSLTEKGLIRFQETGDLIETLLDGSYGKMGASEVGVSSFFCGEEDDFYALYNEYDKGRLYMAHYTYNKEMSVSAENTLTVYSLKENKTVEQAISLFQTQNPDIRVDYSYAVGQYEKPNSDDIRSLNTELLNGEGADVLILDRLPVDSYIEKGVLMDISGLRDELVKDSGMLENIGKALDRDGKVYGIPARVGLPIMAAKDDSGKALESLESLTSYLNENPDAQVLGDSIHTPAAESLLSIMYQDLVKEDGGIDEEKMTQFLDDCLKIFENMDTKMLEEAYGYDPEENEDKNVYFSAGYFSALKDGRVSLYELQGYSSMMYPAYSIKKAGIEPQTIHNCYVPYTIAGINASSKQQEAAELFIKALLADDVQGSETMDGYPVTESAFKNMLAYADTEAAQQDVVSSSFKDPKTGEEVMEEYGNADSQTLQIYLDLIRTLDNPFIPNRTLYDTVMEEVEKCYEGTETSAEAAKAIVQKMDTYLSE